MFDMTLGEMLRYQTKKDPEHEFLVYPDRDLRLTYAQFDHRVDLLAKGLLAIGIKRGDHIGMWATNVPDWLTFLFSCARIGAVFVTVNTMYKLHELEYLMKQSDITTLCLSNGYRDNDYVAMTKTLVPEMDY